MTHKNSSEIKLNNIDSALVDHIKNKNLTYDIITYGCAMNEHDSEIISGILEKMGFSKGEGEQADLILFNTCCIRENAENRLFGNVGALKPVKLKHKNKIIGVCGCMMQQEEAAASLKKRFPFLDLIFGTHNLQNLPEMIENALNFKKTVQVFDTDGYILEGAPVQRTNDFSAYINITYGCNNFCTYCIVPFVRGRERSRKSSNIITEAKQAASEGITEITLLGQNVNSYNNGNDDLSFPDLLRELDKIDGLLRIRFLTSHPKDLSDDLILAMAESKNICHHVHLPVQSGDNEVLKRMNRGYSVEHYLDRLTKIREMIPDAGITSDFIVGFPGETEQQFENTLELLKKAEFDSIYSFIYSVRKGTAAEKMPDQISKEEKSSRMQRLLEVQDKIKERKNKKLEGKEFLVLADKITKKEGQISGRSDCGKIINFPGNKDDIGKYIKVKIVQGLTNSLLGEKV